MESKSGDKKKKKKMKIVDNKQVGEVTKIQGIAFPCLDLCFAQLPLNDLLGSPALLATPTIKHRRLLVASNTENPGDTARTIRRTADFRLQIARHLGRHSILRTPPFQAKHRRHNKCTYYRTR